MSLVLAQWFPLGRFHATRWNQNPFEDSYGEWPPSPWRLFRALAARWFQYSRETGDDNDSARDDLIRSLAHEPPVFFLPDQTWRGRPELRQYQPTEVAWTDALAKAAAYKTPKTTLVADHYRAVPRDEATYWFWENVELRPELRRLLPELLRRTHYFGRAESYCRFRCLEQLPQRVGQQCVLTPSPAGGGVPVLVADPKVEFRVNTVLAPTDDPLLVQRRIPPGTAWYYAVLPRRSRAYQGARVVVALPADQCCVQFAVGGRVYPPPTYWARVTGRFRGRVLRAFFQWISGGRATDFARLTPAERTRSRLLLGKDGKGKPAFSHDHAYFGLWPDENGQPTRLVCWRRQPFTPDELAALLQASEQPIPWDASAPDWKVRLVPLPFSTPTPLHLTATGTAWESVTPFVPPGNRRRFRKNGHLRPGETADRLLVKLLIKAGFPEPQVESATQSRDCGWVHVHETREERLRRVRQRSTTALPGYYFRVRFARPVNGPICLGHSCHFGLGLFGQVQR